MTEIEARLAQSEPQGALQTKQVSSARLSPHIHFLDTPNNDIWIQIEPDERPVEQAAQSARVPSTLDIHDGAFDSLDFDPEKHLTDDDCFFSRDPGISSYQCVTRSLSKERHWTTENERLRSQQQVDTLQDEDLHEFSNPFGRMRLTESGHLRYFGTTSFLSLLPNDLSSLYASSFRNLREEGEAAASAASLHWIPDYDYEQHLTNLYFSWHAPIFNAIEKDIYEQEREAYKSGHDSSLFSPALENAMYDMSPCTIR